MSKTHSESSPLDRLTSEQIVDALAANSCATLLRDYFGPEEYDELRALARKALAARVIHSQRVYLLPGIMGSTLGVRRKSGVRTIWLNPAAIESGELLSLALPSRSAIKPIDAMLPGYLKIKLRLVIAGFDAVFHPFDWRRGLDFSGKQLLARIVREKKRAVAVVGHSMGGLVARAALAQDQQRRIAKVVQLGAPNSGSFAPVQALRAVYPSVRKIASLDPLHSAEQLSRHVFRSLPGIHQLLPAARGAHDIDLSDIANWPEDLLGPDAMLLSRARRVRERLACGTEGCYHIVGVNRETVTSAIKRRGGFEYSITRDGDGTVPRALAEWPGAEHFFVDELHGCLTKNDHVIAGIVDLLTQDRTSKLARTWRPPNKIVRRVFDAQLRKELRGKTAWSALPTEERRRILEPAISPEFIAISKRRS